MMLGVGLEHMKSESTNMQPIICIISKGFRSLLVLNNFYEKKKKNFTKQNMVEHLAYIPLRQKSDS